MGGNSSAEKTCACKSETDCSYCIPVWAIGTAAGGAFVMLVLILVLAVCLCRARRRVRKLAASDPQDQPEVQYASLQNLASVRAGGEGREAPAPHHSDYASVAELKGEEGGGGAGRPNGGADAEDDARGPPVEGAAD